MKKIITFCFLTLFFCQLNAQLYVSPNSYIFDKGTVVYVKDYVNLAANSNFYLRNEAQLLQDESKISSTNTGLGKLSVFQEGTVYNYAYNYWCSPVGNASAAIGNENFGITMLNQPTSLTGFNPIIPVGGYNGSTSATELNIAKYWIWKFQSSSVFADWFHVQDNPILAAGQGFTMKGSSVTSIDNTNVGEIAVNNPGSAQRYDFRGKPNDGDIPMTIGPNKLTLTGNPYPSAMHVNEFLLDNLDCTGIAYYWEQDNSVTSHNIVDYRGGYGSFSPVNTTSNGVYLAATFDSYNLDGTFNSTGAASGLSIIRKYAPIGQGFMILGDATGGTVTLKNSYREFYKETNPLGQSQFEKTASSSNKNQLTDDSNEVPHIRINTMMNYQTTRQLALILVPEATDGVDRGIDAKSAADPNLPNDIYFLIDNDKYLIEGVNFDINKRIPIGIKSTNNSNFDFSVVNVVNFNQNQPVFIYDDFDQSYHNIKDQNYDITLGTGVYENRFEITFKDATLSVEDTIKNNLFVVQNNDNQTLSISNPNLLEVKNVTVYDITGKTIINKSQLETKSNYEFPTSSLSEGVYVVSLKTNDNQSLNQKIVVERTK